MQYDENRAVVTLSVTELCEYACRTGHLDLRPGMGTPSFCRARLGAEAHRKIQASAGALYEAEVPLCHTEVQNGVCYEISGRADGVIHTDPLTVEEIKTVSGKSFDRAPAPLHDAQARTYAYFLCAAKGLSGVNVRLTYYRIEDGKIRSVSAYRTAEELKADFCNLLSRVAFRACDRIERKLERLPSAAAGRFPFSAVRKGQDILLKECYRDICARKRLFAEAPTGTGKTISTLYPAVRCLGEGACDRIFYLTAKASVRSEAYRAAGQIYRAGAHLRTIILTAREQLCRNGIAKEDSAGISRHCNPLDCPYANGFYDRLEPALRFAVEGQNGFPRSTVASVAEQFGICPYEFQLELSEYCDIIICDYNYAFDPQVYLRRYFGEDAPCRERFVFLIDEAHNLADRARAMYSAELADGDFAELLSVLPPTEETCRKIAEKVVLTMQGFRRLCKDTLQTDGEGAEHGYYLSKNPLLSFHQLIGESRRALDGQLMKKQGTPVEGALFSLLSKLRRFERISEYYDDRFLTFLEVDGGRRIIRLLCLDPSSVLAERHKNAVSSILFSATLTPPDYFADILGGGGQAVRLSLPSPFDPANLCVVAATGISTRYGDRNQSYKKIASLIAATVSAKAGNYIVYFPSYEYLEHVSEAFCKRYPSVQTVVQTKGMHAGERETFLNAFCEDNRLRVGFCVLGGSFSEGVDLPGKRLIGTVIVGTGLPGISSERNILREYYDATRERGFDYAYTYPGMNRVLQAAGRVIRREDDRGVIVLIDDRYGDVRMQALLPDHLQALQFAGSAAELAEITGTFWKKSEQTP